MVGSCTARHGVARRGTELMTADRALAIVLLRVLVARSGSAKRAMARCGWVRCGGAWSWKQSVEDWQQSFSECYGDVRRGRERIAMEGLGAVWHGSEWRGEVWQGKG
jgi:hypothetical protein